jgi:hypothetical protein
VTETVLMTVDCSESVFSEACAWDSLCGKRHFQNPSNEMNTRHDAIMMMVTIHGCAWNLSLFHDEN